MSFSDCFCRKKLHGKLTVRNTLFFECQGGNNLQKAAKRYKDTPLIIFFVCVKKERIKYFDRKSELSLRSLFNGYRVSGYFIEFLSVPYMMVFSSAYLHINNNCSARGSLAGKSDFILMYFLQEDFLERKKAFVGCSVFTTLS